MLNVVFIVQRTEIWYNMIVEQPHWVMRNAEKDATEVAEGLIYSSEEQQDMTGELVLPKEIILKAFTKRI